MHAKRWLGFLSLALALLFFVNPAWCGQNVGKALEEAMNSRVTGSVEEVTQQFQSALLQTGNPHQKASILSLLAEYLMEKQECEKAIEIYESIIKEGLDMDKPAAYYGIAQAYMILNQPEKARETCVELNAKFPENSVRSFAMAMKRDNPKGVHAKLADFLEENPSLERLEENVVRANQALQEPVECLPETTTPVDGPSATPPKSEFNAPQEPAISSKPVGPRLGIGAKAWISDISGNIHAKGMDLDLDSEANLDEETGLVLNGSLKLSRKDQLRLNYSRFHHDGRIAKAVTFVGLAYDRGASISGNTRFFDVGLSRLLNESKRASWKLLYGVNFGRMFARLSQMTPTGTRASQVTTSFEVPYLGIEGNTKLTENLQLNGTAKFSSLNHDEGGVRFNDLEIAFLYGRNDAREHAKTEWYGTLGYRYFLLDGDVHNDSANVRYSGPIFGIEWRF